jgi:microcystin-dependent protein
MNAFVGTVMPFPFNFAPFNWKQCNGQLLPIQNYQALFALIGTAYGGNGTSNFALPNLNSPGGQARIAVGQGTGPSLTTRLIGQSLGADFVTLTPSETPPHTHGLQLYANPSNPSNKPSANATLFNPGDAGFLPANSPNPTTLNVVSVSSTGGSQPHNNDQPTLSLTYCICVIGIFPNFG